MRIVLLLALGLSLAACGNKTPESEASRKLGERPKAIVDKAAADAAKALEQGAARTRAADEKSGAK
ncbi:MAG: lipoprotein [Proteobacteria bacterium]|nr:lipoprotein [Pseudomonadota bacterium]